MNDEKRIEVLTSMLFYILPVAYCQLALYSPPLHNNSVTLNQVIRSLQIWQILLK